MALSGEEDHGPAFTWGILGGMAVAFLAWGFLLFFTIGDKGPLDWDFSVIPDIPGESAYSSYNPQLPRGLAPSILPATPVPQHVMGPPTQSQMESLAK